MTESMGMHRQLHWKPQQNQTFAYNGLSFKNNRSISNISVSNAKTIRNALWYHFGSLSQVNASEEVLKSVIQSLH